jgi:hypothetical protein
LGADVWTFFPDENGQPVEPVALTTSGAGNPLNFGIRTMVATSQGVFLGTSNASNLLTEPYNPPDNTLKAGGWELIRIEEIKVAPLGNVGAQNAFPYRDLNLLRGDLWYSFTTTHDGYVVVEATRQGLLGSADLQLIDEHRALDPVAVSTQYFRKEYLKYETKAGKTYYLHVSGTNRDVELSLRNYADPSVAAATLQARDAAFAYLADRSQNQPESGIEPSAVDWIAVYGYWFL